MDVLDKTAADRLKPMPHAQGLAASLAYERGANEHKYQNQKPARGENSARDQTKQGDSRIAAVPLPSQSSAQGSTAAQQGSAKAAVSKAKSKVGFDPKVRTAHIESRSETALRPKAMFPVKKETTYRWDTPPPKLAKEAVQMLNPQSGWRQNVDSGDFTHSNCPWDPAEEAEDRYEEDDHPEYQYDKVEHAYWRAARPI